MDTVYVIHKEFCINIYDEDLAIAFSKAKETYGPKENDVTIENYVNDLMFEKAINEDLKIYIDAMRYSLFEVECYYSDDVYDYVYNFIFDELIRAEKRIESKKIEYI